MPKRSKHASHLLMIVGTVFAFLLVATSIFVVKRKPYSPLIQQNSGPVMRDPAAQEKNIPVVEAVDSTAWKTYRDPVYNFTIRYPDGWADPEAKKISDPDFDYEYQVLFGTEDTLAGDNFEGFDMYVFKTGKCDVFAGNASNQDGSLNGVASNCSTNKSSVPVGTSGLENILEFSSLAYAYTLVPYVPPDNADKNFAKKVSLEFDEAGKSFQFDSSLKAPALKKGVQPATAAAPPKTATPVGKRGKLTGAVSSGGRLVCPHPNRKPQKSPNQGNHVDEDCCPDPDEWPNIACSYKASDYRIMLKIK